MKVITKIFGVQKLIDKMERNGEIEIDFLGGNVRDLFDTLLETHGFQWKDLPLLDKWEENLSITILHNGEILNKDEYSVKKLQDGDRVSFLLHTGCC